VSLSVFAILIFWIIYSIVIQNDFYAYKAHSKDVVNHLVFCIALVVVTIPEGLKLCETIAVSSSLGKLFEMNSLVRSLQAPEMMARCTDICVEATGCLTDSKINIEQISLGGD
jgi:Ca2+-transporting ATPase